MLNQTWVIKNFQSTSRSSRRKMFLAEDNNRLLLQFLYPIFFGRRSDLMTPSFEENQNTRNA
jgi:hypothetical protein